MSPTGSNHAASPLIYPTRLPENAIYRPARYRNPPCPGTPLDAPLTPRSACWEGQQEMSHVPTHKKHPTPPLDGSVIYTCPKVEKKKKVCIVQGPKAWPDSLKWRLTFPKLRAVLYRRGPANPAMEARRLPQVNILAFSQNPFVRRSGGDACLGMRRPC